MTDHESLNAFLHKRSLANEAHCICGALIKNWKHILLECPLYSDFRDLMSMGIRMIGGNVVVTELLSTPECFGSDKAFAR